MVKWCDAYSSDPWGDITEFETEDRGADVFTMGLVLWQDEHSIRVAGTVNQDGTVCSVMTIPMCNVTEILTLHEVDV